MTDQQDSLFPAPKPVAALKPMTDRQAGIYALIRSVEGGVTADELGAMLHEQRGRHAAGERCEWCGQDGARSLREKGIRKRLIRRTGSLYEAKDAADRAVPEQTVQLVEDLPGERFEDIFGDAT